MIEHVRPPALHVPAVPERRGVAPPAHDHRVRARAPRGRVEPARAPPCRRDASSSPKRSGTGATTGASSTTASAPAATATGGAARSRLARGTVGRRRPPAGRPATTAQPRPQPVERERGPDAGHEQRGKVVARDVRVGIAQRDARTCSTNQSPVITTSRGRRTGPAGCPAAPAAIRTPSSSRSVVDDHRWPPSASRSGSTAGHWASGGTSELAPELLAQHEVPEAAGHPPVGVGAHPVRRVGIVERRVHRRADRQVGVDAPR